MFASIFYEGEGSEREGRENKTIFAPPNLGDLERRGDKFFIIIFAPPIFAPPNLLAACPFV
jgi:hypothetical protein